MPSSNNPSSFPSHARPWMYLGLVLAISWLTGFGAAALQEWLPVWAVYLFVYSGSLAVLLTALWLLYTRHDASDRRDFWQRASDWRRISPGWYAVIFLLQPAIVLLGALLDRLGGGAGLAPEALARFAQQPWLILPMLLFWLLFGPLPEELGWRGYALDGLQARYPALTASLLLGGVWALWHLPLYFIDGTWQSETVGLLTPLFWLVMGSLVLQSVLITWIYNNTGRSTLSAILFHFITNAFGELVALTARAEVYAFFLTLLVTVGVILAYGPRRLVRRAPVRQAADMRQSSER